MLIFFCLSPQESNGASARNGIKYTLMLAYANGETLLDSRAILASNDAGAEREKRSSWTERAVAV